MKRFYLKKDVRKSYLGLLGFVVIYFLLQYFWRNQFLPIIFVTVLLIFAAVSILKSRKQKYIQVEEDKVTFKDKLKDREFTFSKNDLKISLLKYDPANGRYYGTAIGFHNNGIENITIGIVNPFMQWKKEEGIIPEVIYKFELNEWDELIKALDLTNEIERKPLKLTEGQQNIAKTVLYAVLLGLIGLAIWVFYYFIYVEKVFEL